MNLSFLLSVELNYIKVTGKVGSERKEEKSGKPRQEKVRKDTKTISCILSLERP